MPVFEKPPIESLSPARERWTPIYLEHGRLEVDDSSVKWIGADRTVMRLPVATLSAVMLGPGTTVTHAAMKACADSNTPVCWIGQDGMRFYAAGATPTADNPNARHQAWMHASQKRRAVVARRMFARRFGDSLDVSQCRIDQLRGLEGQRVRGLYQEMGSRFGVTWKGRSYDRTNWDVSDNINRAVSAANAALYALVAAVVSSLGYVVQLGFIHLDGTMPFVFDIADLYKHETTLEAAFQAVSLSVNCTEKDVLSLLKVKLEEKGMPRRLPGEIKELLVYDRDSGQ